MLWQDVSRVCQCKGNLVRRANNGAVKTRGEGKLKTSTVCRQKEIKN